MPIGVEYQAHVVAESDDGPGEVANTNWVGLWGVSRPARVRFLRAGDQTLDVTWFPAELLGAISISHYTATARPSGATCTSTGSTCRITGLVNSKPQTVTVSAHVGEDWVVATSEASSAVRPQPPIAVAPRRVAAGRPAWMSASGFSAGGQVTIRIDGVVGGRATADAGGAIGPLTVPVPRSVRDTAVFTATEEGPLGRRVVRYLGIPVLGARPPWRPASRPGRW